MVSYQGNRKGELVIQSIFKRRTGDDPVAAQLLARLQRQGYPGLSGLNLEMVLLVEGVSAAVIGPLWKLFHNPTLEEISEASMLDPKDGPIIEVRYKRGITDPEMKSIRHAAEALGINGFEWARLSTRFQFIGVDEKTAHEIIHRYLCNAEVETIVEPGEVWDTLMPQGQAGDVTLIDLASMRIEQLRQMSEDRRLFMSDDLLHALQQFFIRESRPARDAEAEMVGAAWGDHCNHTTMKALGLFQMIRSLKKKFHTSKSRQIAEGPVCCTKRLR